MHTYHEIEQIEDFAARYPVLRGCVIQGLDLRTFSFEVPTLEVADAFFLGCRFAGEEVRARVLEGGGTVFPRFEGLPYRSWRSSLYTWQELMEGYDPQNDQSVDARIYAHFVERGRDRPGILDALAQRIHDHAIDNALHNLLHPGSSPDSARKVVGIMGGHGLPRTASMYQQVAWLSRALTRAGYFVATGGGPGVMEAANLGAWLAPYPDAALSEALTLLQDAPHYTDEDFVARARAVWEQFPNGQESLAIPTWFYGHEPSNLFATHIAKYFSNSLREDGLLALSIHGVVFAPGSAGTLQEVFMDLCQNHYGTLKWISPMVFLDRAYYLDEVPACAMIQRFAGDRLYGKHIAAVDRPEEALAFILEHPPIPVG